MNEQAIVNTIIELENARCRALVEGDLGALGELVDEQLVHIHATGQVDDKHGYLRMVETAIRFLKVERQDLQVRVYADVAVATGRLLQNIEFRVTGEHREMNAIATQIWLRRDSTWRQISFQATYV
jgi:ketosteroid isomerase-like protein